VVEGGGSGGGWAGLFNSPWGGTSPCQDPDYNGKVSVFLITNMPLRDMPKGSCTHFD